MTSAPTPINPKKHGICYTNTETKRRRVEEVLHGAKGLVSLSFSHIEVWIFACVCVVLFGHNLNIRKPSLVARC